MDNHSVASGKEADDHAIHKFMKDVVKDTRNHASGGGIHERRYQ